MVHVYQHMCNVCPTFLLACSMLKQQKNRVIIVRHWTIKLIGHKHRKQVVLLDDYYIYVYLLIAMEVYADKCLFALFPLSCI